MKIIKFTTLVFTLLAAQQAFSMQSDPMIRPLSEQRIKTNQTKLEKKLAVHAKISGTLMVAGAVMTGLSMYKMVREVFKVAQNVVVNPAAAQPAAPVPWQTKATNFATSLGIFCAETTGAIVINKVIADLVGKVMHNGSLDWYLTTQVPYRQTIELMEEVAFHYAHANNAQEAEHHQKRFVEVTNALMVQCEQIIAFMRHKATLGSANSKKLKHEIQAVMSERMSAFSAQLNTAISEGDAQALHTVIRQFKTAFNQDLIRFAYNDQP